MTVHGWTKKNRERPNHMVYYRSPYSQATIVGCTMCLILRHTRLPKTTIKGSETKPPPFKLFWSAWWQTAPQQKSFPQNLFWPLLWILAPRAITAMIKWQAFSDLSEVVPHKEPDLGRSRRDPRCWMRWLPGEVHRCHFLCIVRAPLQHILKDWQLDMAWSAFTPCSGRKFREKVGNKKSMPYSNVCELQEQRKSEVVRCINEWSKGGWHAKEKTMDEWMKEGIKECMKEWRNACMNEWMSERLNEWMNERMKE